jgi:hypothetical protein
MSEKMRVFFRFVSIETIRNTPCQVGKTYWRGPAKATEVNQVRDPSISFQLHIGSGLTGMIADKSSLSAIGDVDQMGGGDETHQRVTT